MLYCIIYTVVLVLFSLELWRPQLLWRDFCKPCLHTVLLCSCLPSKLRPQMVHSLHVSRFLHMHPPIISQTEPPSDEKCRFQAGAVILREQSAAVSLRKHVTLFVVTWMVYLDLSFV